MAMDRVAQLSKFRSVAGEGHFFEETINIKKIKTLLDNRMEGQGAIDAKLEGLKWVLAQTSKGRDMSEFYPDVVKIVAVKHVELKKLSYMYLTHYADVDDTCRELALLAISCFQRDLADSNQLIRALALRVLTSLRVRDIIAIQVIAVQKAATDGSAYVRKTCCHAIPKLFRMDQEQEEPLIEVIAKLLGDRSVMVISSAAAAFDAVCPDRWDIIHPVFRKICHLLSDLDEWGQQITLSVLVRYSRQNFCEPPERASNFDAGIDGGMGFASLEGDDGGVTERSGAIPKVMKTQSLKSFYGGPADGDETDSDSEEAAAEVDLFGGDSAAKVGETPAAPEAVVEEVEEEEERKEMDPDLKLFLRSMLPLLNSRNSGVIVAVATTYVYLGSGSPTVMAALGRALVRELRRPPGIRSIVLCAIRDVAKTRPSMFAGRLRRFFIKFKDSLECRKTKLEIISLLANRGNASTILKEFEAYLHESNVEFLSAVIRCVGRIAEKVPSVGARCLNGLLVLVHSPAAPVVASTVIVIRQLLQQAQSLQRERDAKAVSRGRASSAASALSEGDDSVMDVELAVRRLARMLEVVKVPAARASLVWILGEFQELIPKRAPDILRQLTQGFCDEDVEVKMQIMNAAVKLSLRQPKKKVIMLLRTYILDLARYDTEPDLRDRANTVLRMLASEQMGSAGVLFAVKECPAVAGLIQPTKFVIGSLSHTVAHAARGYKPLPPFTTTPSSASLREVEEDTKDHSTHFGSDSPRRGGSDGVDHGVAFDDKDYYSGDSESGDFYGSGSSDSGSGSGSDSDSSDSSSGSYYEDEESDDVGAAAAKSKKEAKKAKKRAVESSSGSGSDSETDSSSGSYYDDDESGDSDDEPAAKNKTAVPAAAAAAPAAAAAQPAQIDLLMGLFDMGDAGGGGGGASSAPMMEPTMLEMTPAVAVLPLEPATPAVKDSAVPRFPVLSEVKGSGLLIEVEYTRTASQYGSGYVYMHLVLTNTKGHTLCNIAMEPPAKMAKGMDVKPFADILNLHSGNSVNANLHINFGGKAQVAKFKITFDDGECVSVPLKPLLGEVLVPNPIDGTSFESTQKSLSGLQEASCTVDLAAGTDGAALIAGAINAAAVEGGCRFSAFMCGSMSKVLCSLEPKADGSSAKLRVNSDNAMLASSLASVLKKLFV